MGTQGPEGRGQPGGPEAHALAPSAGPGGGPAAEPTTGIPLASFILAVGKSVEAAAQDLRASVLPPGAPGVELRGASLTIKGVLTWDLQGAQMLRPARPADAEPTVSQLVLTYETAPRVPTPGKAVLA